MSGEKRVTIKSIAEDLGVSFSTVSKSLNNCPTIKEETRLMVLERAKSMGYAPNMLARGLRTNSSKTIAVILNDVENPVLTYIFKTISVHMTAMGYTTFICDAQYDAESELAIVRSVLSRSPDAVIIAPASMRSTESIRLLLDSGINLIVFDEPNPELDCNYIAVDYEYGGYISACELLSKGHRNILTITEPLDYPFSLYYVRGIRKAFAEYGVPFPEETLQFVHSSMERGRSLIRSLWDEENHCFILPFTSVMCFSDDLAMGVYKAMRQLGFSIPGDFSVVGFDDNENYEMTDPPLTSIHLPKEKMARNCIEILEAVIASSNQKKMVYSLSPHLMSRGSVRELK